MLFICGEMFVNVCEKCFVQVDLFVEVVWVYVEKEQFVFVIGVWCFIYELFELIVVKFFDMQDYDIGWWFDEVVWYMIEVVV